MSVSREKNQVKRICDMENFTIFVDGGSNDGTVTPNDR